MKAEKIQLLANYLKSKTLSLSSKYFPVFAGVYLIAFVIYGYFFTTIIFTNHSFPNGYVSPYPSPLTHTGRWFADTIKMIMGGSGIQSVQVALGLAIQILGAFLFARLLGISQHALLFLFALALILHPAFLDYFPFTSDHVYFALGDTMAVIGVFVLARVRNPRISIPISAFIFVLVLATYQPKISLVALLLVFWCLAPAINTSQSNECASASSPMSDTLRRIAISSISFILAVGLYYLSTKITVVPSGGKRLYTNSPYEIVQQGVLAYSFVLSFFTVKVDYLPTVIKYLPAICILFGFILLVSRAISINWKYGTIILLLLASIPIALQLSFIINNLTPYSPRILTSHAFFLVFFISLFLSSQTFRFLAVPAFIIFIYYFAIVASQEVNTAAMKNMVDVSTANRIILRIEGITPNLYAKTHSLVVIGQSNVENLHRFKKFQNKVYRAHFYTVMLAPYRQVETLNYFVGKDVFRHPTASEVESAMNSAQSHDAWPAPGSVYLDNSTIVVLLESANSRVETTWSR